MATSAPYIGSKLSLISNSEIRYEGILYTINTQESTIALKSVRCCGTEGRRSPEIPPSSEIYDFIIFRGQDIKDLTVLESASPALSAQLNDPAIMSVNQRPAGSGPPPSSSGGGGGSKGGSGGWKGDDSGYGSGSYGGYGSYGRSSGGGYGAGSGSKGSSGAGKASAKGSSSSGGYWGSSGGGWGSSWDSSWKTEPSYRSGGKAASYGGYGKGESSSGGKGKSEKGGKQSASKGKSEKGAPAGGKGKDKGAGSKGKGEKASAGEGGGRRGGGGEGGGAPVGELIPSVNEAVKSEYAEDFDYSGTNEKFNKIGEVDDSLDEKLKPLTGYDKGKSFFDNISCEATERAGDAERPKVDRNKARQSDRETFGDTRRPPRPAGGRRGGKGGARR